VPNTGLEAGPESREHPEREPELELQQKMQLEPERHVPGPASELPFVGQAGQEPHEARREQLSLAHEHSRR
jgi:hypothetical protein